MTDYNPNYLDFEQPLLEIEKKIDSLKSSANSTQKDLNKIESLHRDLDSKISKIYNLGKRLTKNIW